MHRGPKETFFSKNDIQIANRYMRMCSASLIISKVQIRTTVRYHLAYVRMAVINKLTNKYWQTRGEKATLCTVGGNVNIQPATMEKSMEVPPQN